MSARVRPRRPKASAARRRRVPLSPPLPPRCRPVPVRQGPCAVLRVPCCHPVFRVRPSAPGPYRARSGPRSRTPGPRGSPPLSRAPPEPHGPPQNDRRGRHPSRTQGCHRSATNGTGAHHPVHAQRGATGSAPHRIRSASPDSRSTGTQWGGFRGQLAGHKRGRPRSRRTAEPDGRGAGGPHRAPRTAPPPGVGGSPNRSRRPARPPGGEQPEGAYGRAPGKPVGRCPKDPVHLRRSVPRVGKSTRGTEVSWDTFHPRIRL